MLPFLKNQKEVGASGSSEPIKRKPDEPEDYDYLESAAEDILSAIASKDAKALAVAIKAAFEICDSEPHEEGEHI